MTISFLHAGNETWASWRYRAAAPAAWLGATLNDPTADVLVFSKPTPADPRVAERAKRDGRTVIVDICDPHLYRAEYQYLVRVADVIVCATPVTATTVMTLKVPAPIHVIPEAYAFKERPPHCVRSDVLWFGHSVNYDSYQRVAPTLEDYPVRVMSNVPGALQWCLSGLAVELTAADIVILPATAPHKSANRAVEAIRQGCFVVAEPHPSLSGIPGIWIGNIRDGVKWATTYPSEANARTVLAQNYVRERFSPDAIGQHWRDVITATRASTMSQELTQSV